MNRIVFVLGMTLTAAQFASAENVKVWEGEITIPTYPIYGSDMNPKFYDIEGSIIYPYTMQDDLGDERFDTTYRAVYIENEYLKAICLPQIGGRIHSVLDKTTNQEMFHRNDVIKPGLIAMRGAWISGGIEWNRGPQGHTVTSFAPADVTTQTHADGSASIVIGHTELNFRTRWNVKFTLHPGKAYLHETIRIYNPTEGNHSYYFWNNTAFPCKPGTRFIYPMKLGQDHAGTSFYSWPIHNGKDLTWLKNYDEPSSVFAYQCAFDFFGAYDVDDDRGIVQYGDHRVLTGKKAWTWGQSGDGIASQRALHEDDSQYIEVQSGPLQTQADYGLIGPRQEVVWDEWWYPIHGLGDGFEYATKDLAVQTRRSDTDGGILEINLLATGSYPGAAIRTHKAGESMLASGTEQRIDLTPNSVQTVRVPAQAEEQITITVRAADGALLGNYTTPLDIPERTAPPPTPAPPANPTVEELYFQGVKHEERIEPRQALDAYEKAVAADPGYSPALVALARIDCGKGNYANAAKRCRIALDRDPGSGMAWYYLGLAQMLAKTGEIEGDPLDSAYKSIGTLDAPALGHDLAGRIYMRAGQYAEALAEFRKALANDPFDTRTRDHIVAALYAMDRFEDANREALLLIAADPLNWIPRAIVALQHESDLYDFVQFMQETAGWYEFGMTQTALFLADMGLKADAYRLLSAAYDDAIPNTMGVAYNGKFDDLRQRPTAWYVLGWLAAEIGNEPKAYELLQKARSIAPDYAFPADPRYRPILEYALSVEPTDSNALLMMGNMLAHYGDLAGAVARWESAAAQANPPGVAIRNLGVHAWKKENNLAKAHELYLKAIVARPHDQTLHRDTAQILIAQEKRGNAIELIKNMPLDHPRRGDLTVLLARTHNEEKQYDEALQVLSETKFSNWELNTESWQIFNRAHIERGKLALEAENPEAALEDFSAALTYPDALGVGRPARPQESEGLYWKGKALDALGKKDEARAAWTEGAAGTEGSDRQKEYVALCKTALAG